MTKIYRKFLSTSDNIRLFIHQFFIGWSEAIMAMKTQDAIILTRLSRIKQRREVKEGLRKLEYLRNCDDLC